MAGPGCVQPYGGGELDAFVAVFNSAGTGLVFFTYLGGSGGDGADEVSVVRTGISPAKVYVQGQTVSPDFQTNIGPAFGGIFETFVVRLQIP